MRGKGSGEQLTSSPIQQGEEEGERTIPGKWWGQSQGCCEWRGGARGCQSYGSTLDCEGDWLGEDKAVRGSLCKMKEL